MRNALLILVVVLGISTLGFVAYSFTKQEKLQTVVTTETKETQPISDSEVSKVIDTNNLLIEGRVKSISDQKTEIVVIPFEETESEVSITFNQVDLLVFRQPLSQEEKITSLALSDITEGSIILVYGESLEIPVNAIAVRVAPTPNIKNNNPNIKNRFNSGSDDSL